MMDDEASADRRRKWWCSAVGTAQSTQYDLRCRSSGRPGPREGSGVAANRRDVLLERAVRFLTSLRRVSVICGKRRSSPWPNVGSLATIVGGVSTSTVRGSPEQDAEGCPISLRVARNYEQLKKLTDF